METLRVGEVAKRTGVTQQTIHYYERLGLLSKPPRTPSNYRAYPEDTVLRVHFIKRAQEIGFSLKEIRELLSLRAAPQTQCGDVRKCAEAKVRDINQKVRTLQGMEKALKKLIAECSGKGSVTHCPILEALASEDEKECRASN